MSDRVTLCLPTSNIQTRSVRSQSFNPPPTLGCHRSRRTLSLPAREKPIIPPAITESSECAPVVHDQNSEEMQRHLQGEGCDIGNVMLESMFPLLAPFFYQIYTSLVSLDYLYQLYNETFYQGHLRRI